MKVQYVLDKHEVKNAIRKYLKEKITTDLIPDDDSFKISLDKDIICEYNISP